MTASHPTRPAAAGAGHPRVRQFLNIKRNRAPHPAGALTIEGLWVIRAALEAAVPLEVVFVCPALLRGEHAAGLVAEMAARGAVVLEVSDRVMRRMVDRDGPDGLAAIAHLRPATLGDIGVHAGARVLVADSFELAGNLGAIIRCADGAGAAGVILTDRRIRVSHPLVAKASMGTLFSLPVVAAGREEALAWARRRGFRVMAADPAASVSYRDADYGGPVAIVMGSERYGLASFWKDAADVTVSIPMLGVADSLNVGHAAALLLYEALDRHSRGSLRNRPVG